MTDQQTTEGRVPSPGFVYLFRAENGLFKLGQSFDPRRRFARFRTMPVAIHFVHQIQSSDVNWLEHKLHRQYATKRVRGEWFALTAADVAAVAVSLKLPCLAMAAHSIFRVMGRRYNASIGGGRE